MAQCWRLGPADFWHGPTGSHPSDSLTRIPASSCRHKEPNSAEVQFVHQYELLLSHPLLPSLSATSPLSFVIAIPKLSVAESRDSLFGLAHGFSPQTISAIPASSEKSHLPHFQVANEAGSGWSSSGCSDQPAVEKHHLKPKYFLQQTQPETVKKTKSGCLCCHKITPMSGLENGPSPSRKMLLLPRLKGKKKSFLKLLFSPLLSTYISFTLFTLLIYPT